MTIPAVTNLRQPPKKKNKKRFPPLNRMAALRPERKIVGTKAPFFFFRNYTPRGHLKPKSEGIISLLRVRAGSRAFHQNATARNPSFGATFGAASQAARKKIKTAPSLCKTTLGCAGNRAVAHRNADRAIRPRGFVSCDRCEHFAFGGA